MKNRIVITGYKCLKVVVIILKSFAVDFLLFKQNEISSPQPKSGLYVGRHWLWLCILQSCCIWARVRKLYHVYAGPQENSMGNDLDQINLLLSAYIKYSKNGTFPNSCSIIIVYVLTQNVRKIQNYILKV